MMNKKLLTKSILGGTLTLGLVATAVLLKKEPLELTEMSLHGAEVVTTASEAKSKLRPRSQTDPTPAPQVLIAEEVKSFVVPEDQRTALQEFSRIGRKVFKNEEDKSSTTKLINDDNFLLSLADLLKSYNSEDVEFKSLQNNAVDLLLEAALASPSGVAHQVLMSIVTDPQIESESLDANRRQALAGVKAEVMYLWSSQSPEVSKEISASITGKATQKIWQNVLDTQEANHQESLAEVRSN